MSPASPREWRDRAAEIVSGLTVAEMAELCSGQDFWNTKTLPEHAIEGFMLTDGPHGLRKQSTSADHLGLNESVPATCFPSGAGLASSWNRELLRAVGRALGREAAAERVGVLLGPAINIKRHPLGGRNFEYFSEDPLLTGELAAAYIGGVQGEGVGTSVKHFAANNQETNRLLVDAVVDDQALREIYLRGFEIAITNAQPWTVMSAYNKINGTYASDNSWLLTEVLRDEWGFEGVVVSDWGAEDDRTAGLHAGMDLEMPGNGGLGDAEIVAAVNDGSLDREVLVQAAIRIVSLHLAVASWQSRGGTTAAAVDQSAHHALAREAATEAAVLLKNEGVLPISADCTVGVLGTFAETPRYQGGGSSRINPTNVESLLGALRSKGPTRVCYAPGYVVGDPAPDPRLLDEARDIASQSDVVVVMIGLTDQEESEGYDRAHMRLSASHNALVEAACDVCRRVVVVLSNGAPVEMPWIDDVPAVLEAYLGGQASGAALAEMLFGESEPRGRLAETLPFRVEDSPAYLNFPGSRACVEYREGIFVGYRFYDTARREPLFPFGHGLGYADIRLLSSQTDTTELQNAGRVRITIELANMSEREGAQVVQVYAHQRNAQPARPEQELVAFEKITLGAREHRVLHLVVDHGTLRRWSTESAQWVVDGGEYEFRIGTSSRAIAHRHEVLVQGTSQDVVSYGRNTALGSLLDHPVLGAWARDLRTRFIAGQGDYADDSAERLLVEAFTRELPLRSLVRVGRMISQAELERACRVLSGTADASDVGYFNRAVA